MFSLAAFQIFLLSLIFGDFYYDEPKEWVSFFLLVCSARVLRGFLI